MVFRKPLNIIAPKRGYQCNIIKKVFLKIIYFYFNLRIRTVNFPVLTGFSQGYSNLLFYLLSFDEFLALQFLHFLRL